MKENLIKAPAGRTFPPVRELLTARLRGLIIRRDWRHVVIAISIGATLALLLPQNAQGQPPPGGGDCAGCTDCFTCKGDLQFGTEDCNQQGTDPDCPCQNVGSACNPEFAIAPAAEIRLLVVRDAGANGHLLRLDDHAFGQFDCGTGDLTAVLVEDVNGFLRQIPANAFAKYAQRYHLSTYLDVTGVLRKRPEVLTSTSVRPAADGPR